MIKKKIHKGIFYNIKLSLTCARFFQWSKNIFMIPGFALALTLEKKITADLFISFLIALIATGFLASANYSLNELLDKNYDANHPQKKFRPLARGYNLKKYIIFQYAIFCLIGLSLSLFLEPMFLMISLFFLLMGIIYNVKPIRAKEIPYIDVLVEAINNPIRLILGWASICTIILPPLSFIVCYWFGGAFLMSMKRFSEYKFIGDKEIASKYRKSFKYYNEKNLLLSSFFYALICVFFLAIFTIKYFIELIIVFPLISILFIWYTKHCLDLIKLNKKNSNFFHNKNFLSYCFILGILILMLFFVEFSFLDFLIDHSYISDIKIEWD